MDDFLKFIAQQPWLSAGLLFIAIILTGWLLWRLLYRWLHKIAARTETQWDDMIIAALRPSLLILTLICAAEIATRLPEIPEKADHLLHMFLKVGAMLAVVVFVDRVIIGFLAQAGKDVQQIAGGQAIIRLTVHVVVYVIGALVILDTMGVQVTAVLTTLGVGTLAIALALQPTLASFVAGFQIAIDRTVNIGDVIALSTGQRGTVVDIGWRTTKILAADNNILYIPNSKLVGELLTNFNQPERDTEMSLIFGVHYQSNLDRVEELCKTLSKQAYEKVTEKSFDKEVTVRFRSFNESAIETAIFIPIEEYKIQFALRHELIKQIQKEFAREGIIIPYPTRTVEMAEKKIV